MSRNDTSQGTLMSLKHSLCYKGALGPYRIRSIMLCLGYMRALKWEGTLRGPLGVISNAWGHSEYSGVSCVTIEGMQVPFLPFIKTISQTRWKIFN